MTEAPSRQVGVLALARVLFLVATAFFAWWSLRGRFDEVGEALRSTSWLGALVALALVVTGLLLTGFLWLRVLDGYGYRLPFGDGFAIFFVGQLGKYVPGSVWSIGAQAQLARPHAVPPRATVGASLVFLGFNVATAALAGGVVTLAGGVSLGMQNWLVAIGVLSVLAGLLPSVVNTLGTRVGGAPLRLRIIDALVAVALMTVVWTLYALALLALVPDPSWRVLAALGGAFTIGYAVGVVIVFAPAGLGAREATFIALLTPVTDLATATSVALLARVVHLVADFGVAGATWWLANRARRATTESSLLPR
jgi:uncharacterized membrane protein YbhN (UPF0104 family)